MPRKRTPATPVQTTVDVLVNDIAMASMLGTAAQATQEGGQANVWSELQEARTAYLAKLSHANDLLKNQVNTKWAAHFLAKEAGGVPVEETPIEILADGTAVLRVTRAAPPGGGKSPVEEGKLPNINFLRRRAVELGIDPAPHGTKRKPLLAAIQAVEQGRPV